MYFAFFKKILSNAANFTSILEKFVLRIICYLLLKAISLGNEVEYESIFLLSSSVIEIKNENQREGFKSV